MHHYSMESLCGLRCDHCGAWKAKDNQEQQQRTSETWNLKYNLSLKPRDISCSGCLKGPGVLISSLWKKYGSDFVSQQDCRECVAKGKNSKCVPCQMRECGTCKVKRAPFFNSDGTVNHERYDTFRHALDEQQEIRGLFGSHLRALRKAAGLTLQELSARCGISLQYLSEIERGAKNPPLSTLATVADALSLPMADLFSIPELQQDGMTALLARVKQLPETEQEKISAFLRMMVGD